MTLRDWSKLLFLGLSAIPSVVSCLATVVAFALWSGLVVVARSVKVHGSRVVAVGGLISLSFVASEGPIGLALLP